MKRNVMSFVIAAIAGVIIIGSCEPESSPIKPNAKSAVCASGLTDSIVHYHMYYPNGGEVFKQGDTVIVSFCSQNSSYGLDDPDRKLSIDGGLTWNDISYDEGAAGIQPNGYKWVVPDSFYNQNEGRNVSSVSDKCLLWISIYSADTRFTTEDFDVSNKVFKIESR